MVTPRQQFDEHLRELRSKLIEMGQMVEKAISDAVASLKESNMELAKTVLDADAAINRMEDHIDEIGTALIVTQQPVAKDLRRIIMAFRMASDLERMADLAVDIAKVTLRIGGEGLIKPLIDIPHMADLVIQMTNESIQSFVDENVDMAYKAAQMDDEVDHLYSRILRELMSFANKDNAQTTNQIMLLSFASHHLERMADHATNISESVVYLVTSKRPDLNQ